MQGGGGSGGGSTAAERRRLADPERVIGDGRLEALRDSGLSVLQIAERVGMTYGDVRRHLTETERIWAADPMEGDVLEWIVSMYEEGHQQKQIADALSMPRNTIMNALRRSGVRIRHRYEREGRLRDRLDEVAAGYQEGLTYQAIADKMGGEARKKNVWVAVQFLKDIGELE